MTLAAQNILVAFDALDAEEQQRVAVEILRRSAGVEDLPDETFDELAADVFHVYDAEESTGGDS
jgi:hypothetical protein